MKVIFDGRERIYELLNAVFQTVDISPIVAEIGVLDGQNAKKIYDILNPGKLYLIDAWSTAINTEYSLINSARPWVDPPDVYSSYYGGDVRDQRTFDRLYERAIERFYRCSNVELIRKDRIDALNALGVSKSHFDMIYLDASHQFEQVFDDLMACQKVLSKNGFIQMNDCCHSPDGIRQNLGVLEANLKFCKMNQFEPIVLTNTDWTDVLITRLDNPLIALIDQIFAVNVVRFVEVPNQLLGALNIRYGRTRNVSFV
jgi:hypothetical protein